MPISPVLDRVLSVREHDDLQVMLTGAFAPLTTYLGPDQLASVRLHGQLADGVPWRLPLQLSVDGPVSVGLRVVLRDLEFAPVAELTVSEAWADTGTVLVTGDLTPAPREMELVEPRLVVVADRPLTRADEATIAEAATHLGLRVRILVLTGSGRAYGRGPLVTALRSAARGLDAEVGTLPLAQHADVDPALPLLVASRFRGAVVYPCLIDPREATAVLPEESVQVLDASAGLYQWQQVLGQHSSGAPVLANSLAEGTWATVQRLLDGSRKGLVVLFTGLSGSGKSTIARSLADRLEENRLVPVTLLDGDVVRRELSAGLGFSREDRERNVRRIGWVAAEIARHGGIVVCCPIAPYESTRQQVRDLVEQQRGRFVLVYVATPLEVCEARDRKGLYARARAGEIPNFTGISDPYEPPTEADVVVDTSTSSLDDCVRAILGYLKAD